MKVNKELMKEVLRLLVPTTAVYTVYKTPSQLLREQANEIDRKEEVIRAFQSFVDSLE